MPRPPIEPKVCGEPAEDGQKCNLPKGHDPKEAHTYISPKEAAREADLDAAHDDVDALNAATPPETPAEAAKRIYGEDAVQRPVISKLARIMLSLPEIKPEGRNQHFGYGFIKDTQISGALRPRMAKEGLMVIPEVLDEHWIETKTSKGGISYVTKMKIRFTVIDGDSGDSVTGVGVGYGDDAGDKGANKAFTAAMKYWLMKLFQIGGEDNEDDSRADERASARADGPTTEVKVEGAKIEGIERGGKSTKITATQMKQMFAIYKELELTPEKFADIISESVGDKLVIEPDGDATTALNAYLKSLDADDAGTLLTALVEAKDAQASAAEGFEAPSD